MRRALLPVALVSALLATGSAGAQGADDDDLRLATRTLQNVLEDVADGETGTWRNPSTGVSGRITVLRTGLTDDGRRCRQYRHVWLLPRAETSYLGVYCREPNGIWKIHEDERQEWTKARDPAAATRSADLRRLQGSLATLLYLTGSPSGEMDAATRDAIGRFVADEQLALGGEPDVTALADYADKVVARNVPAAGCPIPAPTGGIGACGTL